MSVAWTSKVLGGLIGGMVGGPVGAGIGVALGHYLGDARLPLQVQQLHYQHHAFTASGPAMLLTPEWMARGLEGVDCGVTLSWPGFSQTEVVIPDAAEEVCHLPLFFVPYAHAPEGARVSVTVTLRAPGARTDRASFDVPLPSPVRRLGLSGPSRTVMALVACARAGGRRLERVDIRFIRDSFTDAHPLDEDGVQWLKAWLRELDLAEAERLSAPKVAERLRPHLDRQGAAAVLLWLYQGTREAWPGPAAMNFVEELGQHLGVSAEDAAAIGRDLERPLHHRVEALTELGLGPTATRDEAHAAWLKLVQRHHPDRADDPAAATRKVARLNAAWNLLKG